MPLWVGGEERQVNLHPQAELPGQVLVTLGGTPGAIRLRLYDGSYLEHGQALTNPPPQSTYAEALAPGAASVNIAFRHETTNSVPDYSCSFSLPVMAYGVEIEVTSLKDGVSVNPPPFEGGKVHPFNPAKPGNLLPDKHFVVLYKDVVNSSFTVQDFSIKLKANITPGMSSSAINARNPRWSLLSRPWGSGALMSTTGVEVNFENPKEGGVYKFAFDLDGYPRTEFCIVLPLAGAEMDGVMQADLLLADAFVAVLTDNYTSKQLRARDNLEKWFVDFNRGDYVGRPDSQLTPSVWYYGQVNTVGGEEYRLGAVCTWKGRPVLLTKPSNFIIGYAMQKIGIGRTKAQAGTLSWRNIINWTFTDGASVGAGWDVANGANYGTTVSSLVNYIWTHEADDCKSKKVWPNPNPPDNRKDSPFYNDFVIDRHYAAPGFLFIKQ